MRKNHLWIAAAVAGAVIGSGAVTGGATPAHAYADRSVAVWDMDESPGDRTMRDSSGNHVYGQIGPEVGLGGGYYHFERLQPDTPPARPGHLVIVPDQPDLDPGTRDFAVTVRLRTTDYFGNIVQKGQATVAGGSFKLQIPSGHVQCWFRGAHQVMVTAPDRINDGQWHTVRCERYGDVVDLMIDGRTVASKTGRTGSIANSWPLSIGGKPQCDQIEVGCDYFTGDIDYVALETGDDDW